jgi:hypothetical protein
MAGAARYAAQLRADMGCWHTVAVPEFVFKKDPPYTIGVVTVEVLEARLPPRVHTITRKEKPLHPYAAMVIGSAGTSVECVAIHVMCRTPVHLAKQSVPSMPCPAMLETWGVQLRNWVRMQV